MGLTAMLNHFLDTLQVLGPVLGAFSDFARIHSQRDSERRWQCSSSEQLFVERS